MLITQRNKKTKQKHFQSLTEPVRSIADNLDFRFLPQCEAIPSLLIELESLLRQKDNFQFIVLDTNCVWKVPGQDPDSLCQSQHTIEIVKKQIPTFHTRAMRQSLMQKYGRVAPNIKPAVLRSLYRDLTDDSSAATNEHMAEIDERVRLILDMEDPNVVLDLRTLNTGNKSQYDVFWDECKKFLEEEVGTPVDDRRHDQVLELAVKFRSFSNFSCVDDKHRGKVGEPGFPVAAAERGRQVLVSLNSLFQVGDHNFTQHSIVPSVCFLVDILETVESSWYTGQVAVGLKAFEPSSPARHCTELAPFHSWRNPVERIMSLLNIGLQSIGLMRKQMDDEFEAAVAKCKNMKQLRAAAEKNPTIKDGTLDSIAPVKLLMSCVFHRLSLKEKRSNPSQQPPQPKLKSFCQA
ncbi:Hypothetical predicted protein [Paramuricea clavata]|uniref:Uncharacterized protein n=1 Tax=Paramuricea clavata TaxID=317549 RepID=A0A6S7GTW0_PARCT|nr:Hypothetical predicted protein [Paramuricea clavata]